MFFIVPNGPWSLLELLLSDRGIESILVLCIGSLHCADANAFEQFVIEQALVLGCVSGSCRSQL